MLRLVFHYDPSPGLAARLVGLAARGLAVEACGEADDARFAALMAEADVLAHCLRPVTAADIAGAPRLRLIQKIGVGVNTIDLDAARSAGVAVCNMPGTNSRAVAEHTLALMLACLRRVPQFDRAMRAGAGWGWPAALQDRLGEIGGRTVGLVGFGAVPQLLAPVLDALGAEVVYAARRPHPKAVARHLPLDELLGLCDIVSLHLPLTAETAGIIDAGAFARMAPGAILVNTARGGLVDEPSLIAALAEGRLAAAGLDTFAVEPVPGGNPLLAMDGVVATPHVAWLTPETLERSLAVLAENCRRLAAGEPLLHRVA
jgi:phosphoglycerate dehydrogenase-like enzyme